MEYFMSCYKLLYVCFTDYVSVFFFYLLLKVINLVGLNQTFIRWLRKTQNQTIDTYAAKYKLKLVKQ